jgi:hypothetical protein
MILFALAVAGAAVAVAILTSGAPINYSKALLAVLVAFTSAAAAYRMNASRNA